MTSLQQEAVSVRVQTPVPEHRPGRAWWPAALIGALTLILYAPVITKLVSDWWTDPNFSHGFFVPLFSGYLLWVNRRELSAVAPRPSWIGAVVVIVSLAILVLGRLGAELFLARISLLLLLAGIAILFGGWRFYRRVFFAWAFLFLMVPIPTIIFNQITFPLQLLASQLASSLLPLAGVPVLREGNVIMLPAMPLEVAEACSGIRSLLSLGTLAIMYGYFLDSNAWRRVFLAVCAVPIAVAANALRIVGTGLCVQYWDPDKALGFFHEFSGWVVFIVSLVILWLVHAATKLVWHDRQVLQP